MQIIVILGFAVSLALTETELLQESGPWLVPVLAGYLAVTALLRAAETALCLGMLDGPQDRARRRLQPAAVLSVVGKLWLVLGSAGTILLGLGHAVQVRMGLDRYPLLDKLVVLGPFVLALLIYWVLEYPFHLALRRKLARIEASRGQSPGRIWSLGQFLAFNVRHQLLFVAVPVSLILLATDVLQLYVRPRLAWTGRAEGITMAGTLGVALVVFLIVPLLIVRVWKTRPLGQGPVREELEQMCRQLGLRYRRLLVWESDGVMANAGVMGIVSPVRYVLMSDALLAEMQPEQIRAIFAHEAGHVKHHHILHAMVFAVTTVLLSDVLNVWLWVAFGWPLWLTTATALLALLGSWAAGFGWLSRRFERQADIIAAWTCGPPPEARDDPERITPEGSAIFASALEEVARLNYVDRHQRNWRHGPIAWRVGHILHLGATGGTRRRINRLVFRVKIALWASLAGAVALTLWSYGAFD